jgi:response regulator RpfG family c-di-GMP phosphodiesterase
MSDEQEKIVGGRILFVDDEVNILRALRRLFMDDAFEVFTADSGQEALQLLEREGEMGVIVSDQRMPVMSGVDFLEKSKKIAPHSVRILLTGYADINAAVDAINRGGAWRYLHKPWKDEELLQTAQAAFKYYNLVKENKRLTALVLKQNEKLASWNEELEKKVAKQTLALQARNTQLRTNFKNTILAFSSLLEMRDKQMRAHSRNVAEIAGQVATALELEQKEREALVAAALLHDIGKIGIPDLLLHKKVGEMTEQEGQEYRNHAVRGQTAVDGIQELREAGLLIRHHHERYDGEGFPDGLKKKEIPLGARILAIIDFFDKELRIYTGNAGLELVAAKVESEEGAAFDPRLLKTIIPLARKFYLANLPDGELTEQELTPDDLQDGMITSRDVISGTGVLLLRAGSVLNGANIATLRRYYRMDPAKQGIFITLQPKNPE